MKFETGDTDRTYLSYICNFLYNLIFSWIDITILYIHFQVAQFLFKHYFPLVELVHRLLPQNDRLDENNPSNTLNKYIDFPIDPPALDSIIQKVKSHF